MIEKMFRKVERFIYINVVLRNFMYYTEFNADLGSIKIKFS